MNFIRKKDEIVYRLASMQARIFEKASVSGLPSYHFIHAFLRSSDAASIDDLSFLIGGSSEAEVYLNVTASLKKRSGGTIYPPNVMHWMGFFYRYGVYLSGISSAKLIKMVSPKHLFGVYEAYHGLDIEKAVKRVFDELNIDNPTPAERFAFLFQNKLLKRV